MEITQTYQEVSKVILEGLVANPVDFKKTNLQAYFYGLKEENPIKYEGLVFDTNGHEPYSEDLSHIFRDFLRCGFTDFDKKIIPSSLDEIKEHINSVD